MDWPAGEDKMLVVSIGTGTSPQANADLDPNEMNLLYNAGSIPSRADVCSAQRTGHAVSHFRPVSCRDELDREVGTLIGAKGPVGPGKLFTYVRYNAELSPKGLSDLGWRASSRKTCRSSIQWSTSPSCSGWGRRLAKR